MLALYVVGAASILFLAPSTRRPAAIHFVAMHTGALVGYSFFAVLIAASVKAIRKAQWEWYDWANSVVVLTAVIFAFRLWSADTIDDRQQPTEHSTNTELSPKREMKDEAQVASIVGLWKCSALSTGASLIVSYEPNGRIAISTVGSTRPAMDGPVFWEIQDGNLLVQRYADGQRFTKSQITRIASKSFATLAPNGAEVTCERILEKGVP